MFGGNFSATHTDARFQFLMRKFAWWKSQNQNYKLVSFNQLIIQLSQIYINYYILIENSLKIDANKNFSAIYIRKFP